MQNQGSNCLLLLLDDDEDDYIILKQMLKDAFQEHVTLHWFQQDHFATDMICSGMYAVTLVDYKLGSENGLEVIRKAKAVCAHQKVFLLTAYQAEDLEDQVRAVGGDGRLSKDELSISFVKKMFEPMIDAGCLVD